MTNQIINPQNGNLKISNIIIISKHTQREDLLRYFGNTNVKIDVKRTGNSHYFVPEVWINNIDFSFDFIFYGTQLDSISFGFDYSPDDNWDNWSIEKELKRAEKYDTWLTQQVGPTRDFAWGAVWAGFDQKGGWSGLGLRYKLKEVKLAPIFGNRKIVEN